MSDEQTFRVYALHTIQHTIAVDISATSPESAEAIARRLLREDPSRFTLHQTMESLEIDYDATEAIGPDGRRENIHPGLRRRSTPAATDPQT